MIINEKSTPGDRKSKIPRSSLANCIDFFLLTDLFCLQPWMIVPPVRIWFGSVRSEVFTNRWFVIGTWLDYLVRSYMVPYQFGTN